MQGETNRLQGWVGCVTGGGCIAGACCWGADCAGGYLHARFLRPVAHLHPGEMDMWPRVCHAQLFNMRVDFQARYVFLSLQQFITVWGVHTREHVHCKCTCFVYEQSYQSAVTLATCGIVA